ncbi:MAG: adenylate/guanylate cyclase domain-containing protein [Pseudomonadota bacterium]
MIRLFSNRWVQIVLLLLLLAGSAALRRQDPKVVHQWRQLTFDTYNRKFPRAPGSGVMIVDIDEDSLRRHGQWPWPRPLVAQILDILHQMGAKVVAFDMVFAEPDRTSPSLIAETLPQTPEMRLVAQALKALPDNDQVFAEKIAEVGNVVTGFVASDQPTPHDPVLKTAFFKEGINPDAERFIVKKRYFAASLPALVNSAAGNGSFTPSQEQDGVIRSVPLLIGQKFPDGRVVMYPSLSLEALRVAQKKVVFRVKSFGKKTQEGYGIQSVSIGDYTIPTDEQGNFQVYYAGHRQDLYVPAWKVLTQQLEPDFVKDKIVFVGASAIGLLDLRASPLNAVLPGVEIHAEIVEQILDGKFLERPAYSDGAEIFIIIAVGLLIIFLAPFINTGTLALLVAALIGGGGAGALYAYQSYGYLIDFVYPSLSIVTIFILSSILTNLRSEMERREVRDAFSHYLSPELVEELASHPDMLKLGGEVRELSVMFTDIRNFTALSESMDPAELIRLMNDFLTPMTSCVLNNRGTVDKYMGDAMMAFWNAPMDDSDHARHACTSALQMLAALSVLNKSLRARAEENNGAFTELRAGIGIHTGKCSVGNMGSKQRFAYSALGDTVNLASRLEGQTKSYGISVMISEAARRQAPEFAAIEIDLLTVKGRAEPERVYALLGDAAFAKTSVFQEFSALHAEMLRAYREQRWDEAASLAKRCRDVRPDLTPRSRLCDNFNVEQPLTTRPDLRALYEMYLQRISDFKSGVRSPGSNWRGVWGAKEK